MSTRDFIPTTDADRIVWLTNLKDKLPAQATALGLTAAEVTQTQNNCSLLVAKIQAVKTARTNLADAVKLKETTTATVITAIRTAAKKWKTANGYTPNIGESLDIIGETEALFEAEYKAEITAKVEANLVRIRFVKKGAEGVNIYYRKKGELEWIFLARDTKSPYDDHVVLETPNVPLHLEYRAFGVIDDTEIGQASDIVEIVFGA